MSYEPGDLDKAEIASCMERLRSMSLESIAKLIYNLECQASYWQDHAKRIDRLRPYLGNEPAKPPARTAPVKRRRKRST